MARSRSGARSSGRCSRSSPRCRPRRLDRPARGRALGGGAVAHRSDLAAGFVGGLRKALGAETLGTRPPGYVLRVEPEQVDLERFLRLRESARGRPPAERAELLREAFELWRGTPLAEFRYELWA